MIPVSSLGVAVLLDSPGRDLLAVLRGVFVKTVMIPVSSLGVAVLLDSPGRDLLADPVLAIPALRSDPGPP